MLTYLALSMNILFLLTIMLNNSHPVKLSLNLIILSMLLFLSMHMESANSWYPTIFFLIFMGGILMMFMILSSILPNEKSKKSKNSLILLATFIFLVYNQKMNNFQNESTSNLVKMILDSSNSLAFLMSVMLMYFFFTLKTLIKEENPMRSHLCYKT